MRVPTRLSHGAYPIITITTPCFKALTLTLLRALVIFWESAYLGCTLCLTDEFRYGGHVLKECWIGRIVAHDSLEIILIVIRDDAIFLRIVLVFRGDLRVQQPSTLLLLSRRLVCSSISIPIIVVAWRVLVPHNYCLWLHKSIHFAVKCILASIFIELGDGHWKVFLIPASASFIGSNHLLLDVLTLVCAVAAEKFVLVDVVFVADDIDLRSVLLVVRAHSLGSMLASFWLVLCRLCLLIHVHLLRAYILKGWLKQGLLRQILLLFNDLAFLNLLWSSEQIKFKIGYNLRGLLKKGEVSSSNQAVFFFVFEICRTKPTLHHLLNIYIFT